MLSKSQATLSFAQRMVLLGLLLCMALAQSLSVAHRTLHHDVRMLAHAHDEQTAERNSAHQHAHTSGEDCDHGIFSRLFASHDEGDESCRVMQAASAHLELNSPLPGVFIVLNAHVFIAIFAQALGSWQAPLFEARGPPAVSL
jgi:hypothetical protein